MNNQLILALGVVTLALCLFPNASGLALNPGIETLKMEVGGTYNPDKCLKTACFPLGSSGEETTAPLLFSWKGKATSNKAVLKYCLVAGCSA